MFIRSITALAFVALAAVGALGVTAQDALSPEEAVAMRQELMKSNGAVLQGGAMDKTGDEAIAAAQTLVDNFTQLPDLFPEGSAIEGSRALPAIWENWEDFTAILDTAKGGAEAALAGAQAGDVDAYKAGLETVMGQCGACHEKYRAS
jgi:cytochrome c556